MIIRNAGRLLLCGLLASATMMAQGEVSQPNIVIIFNDDMGCADVGCFGAEKNKTPRIDKLAEEGRRDRGNRLLYRASPRRAEGERC